MLQCRTCDHENICKHVEVMEQLDQLDLPPGVYISGACTKHKETK